MKTIDILLSVYGKAEFLGDFLQSLKRQDFQKYHLLYRFDSEADPQAEKILQEFPRSIELPGRKHLGVVRSYQTLLNASSADYLMFADQDDIWHPDKISKSVAAIEKLEENLENPVPLLLHTDLRVIDRNGVLISPSLWKFQVLNPQKNQLQDLMIQNNVTGCSMILNRTLANIAASFPDAAICHDWYLAMTAAAFGKVAYLNQATIDYRQHSNNVYGAVPRKNFMTKLQNRRQLHKRIELTQKQAQAFLGQFQTELDPDQIKILHIWGNTLSQMSYCKRIFTALRYHFQKNDRMRTLGMWWAL